MRALTAWCANTAQLTAASSAATLMAVRLAANALRGAWQAWAAIVRTRAAKQVNNNHNSRHAEPVIAMLRRHPGSCLLNVP